MSTLSEPTATATPPSAATRALLVCGAVAGPVFVGATLIQSATREGFDPAKHPLSLLSLSDLGWIQITNFVLCGLLALAGAIGLARVMPSGVGATWGPRLIGVYGVALVWGGVFVADPALGYPEGAPEGSPESQSWHSILHAFAPVIAGLALIAACIVLARRFRRQGRTGWFVASVVVPIAYAVLASVAFPADDFRWMLAGGALIWLWAAAVPAQALVRGTT
jgi:uncharacterized membrane protein YhaH (DUF805 family)